MAEIKATECCHSPYQITVFESGSKRFEPGEKYSGLYGKFYIVELSYFIPF